MMQYLVTPRLSDPLSISIVDIRRPFSEYSFLRQFDSLPSLFTVFAQARQLGARTLVIEDISSTSAIDHESEFILRQFPTYKMLSLKRLTFWKSHFTDPEDIKAQSERYLIGYAILQQESVNVTDVAPNWHIFESVLSLPEGAEVFIPRFNTFQIKCSSSLFMISGVLFCGKDNFIKTCALTSLRSISSHMLNRDVSYSEIISILSPDDLTLGLTIQEISRVLNALKIDHKLVRPEGDDELTVNNLILNTITARSGCLVAFKTENSEIGHLLFIYGYTINPHSVQFILGSSYFSDRYKGRLYNSISPWIGSFICTDDNFGPYCFLPPYFFPLRKPEILISAIPSNVKCDGMEASIIAPVIFQQILRSLETEEKKWLPILVDSIDRNQVVYNSSLMDSEEYFHYLSSVRDWDNNCEDKELVPILKETMRLNKFWVFEFTLPELMSSFLKLGEIVLSAETTTDLSEENIWGNFIVARFPSLYVIPHGNTEIQQIPSKLQSQTPFMQGGESRRYMVQNQYKYQIALSFAGEDRTYAEQIAELLSSKNISVFYDKYEKAQLWGKDLYQHLQKVYRDKAQYCVVFLSANYAKKLWTKHELKQAQTRAFKENEEYILPLKIDDTEIPGINETIGYIDIREDGINVVSDLILQKLGL